MTVESKMWHGILGVLGGIVSSLAKNEAGRALLKAFPQTFTFGLFRNGGPSEKEMKESNFEVSMQSKGWSAQSTPLNAEGQAAGEPDD